MNDAQDLRDGIIDMNTRQFGTVAEVVIQILKNHIKSNRLDFDLIHNIHNQKIEIKASRVFKKQQLDITPDNFFDLVSHNSNRDRLINQKDASKNIFDCNIQQIKIKLFNILIYLLFFKDVIEIFEIKNQKIKTDKKIKYSDKQHRGNKAEGQFHINNENYPHHKENYFVQSVTYQELVRESKKLKR